MNVLYLKRFKTDNPLETLEPVADGNYILKLQKLIREIHMDASLSRYIVDIVGATRAHPDVVLGASPRGSLNLYRVSQAWAFYNGRNHVLPDDIKKMVVPVLSHRVFLKQEAKLKKITSGDILRDIMRSVKVPA